MYRIVFLTIVLSVLSLTQIACQSGGSVVPETVSATPAASPTPLALKYEDLVAGDGIRAMWGGTVTVKYVGKLTDGTVFDQGKLDYKLGDTGVIRGFNLGIGGGEGVEAMRVGGKRKVTLPPDLAYGSTGDGRKIPPNATITFELELLKVQGGMGF
ncbi:MAG: FKBP-type peptidyl-prolyl cis-trans isomerase [Blastocatellia bacterium]|nr:FKBP-type peptidyl-prolyl cis-trans isomerase [Blastocatellia bacterium]